MYSSCIISVIKDSFAVSLAHFRKHVLHLLHHGFWPEDSHLSTQAKDPRKELRTNRNWNCNLEMISGHADIFTLLNRYAHSQEDKILELSKKMSQILK